MNTLGKILMGLLMLCLLAATYFTTGVLKARSTWLQKIEATSKQIADADEKLKSAKKQFEDARDLVHQENLKWGKAYTAPNSGPAPAGDGSVDLGAGSDVGIGRGQPDPTKLPIVHIFGMDAQNKSVYVGDFQLTEVRQGISGGMLTRPPFTGEVASWPSGEYRVRDVVPSDFLSAVAALRTMIMLAEQDDRQEQAMLVYQNENLAASQAALDQRMLELNGDAAAPATAGPDVIDGLVQTMRREETARNALVKQVDALRRELSAMHLQLTTTLTENQASIHKLSGTVSTQP